MASTKGRVKLKPGDSVCKGLEDGQCGECRKMGGERRWTRGAGGTCFSRIAGQLLPILFSESNIKGSRVGDW